MRHHLPFDMEPGPDGNPRVIRGACGFTEESIELYMAVRLGWAAAIGAGVAGYSAAAHLGCTCSRAL